MSSTTPTSSSFFNFRFARSRTVMLTLFTLVVLSCLGVIWSFLNVIHGWWGTILWQWANMVISVFVVGIFVGTIADYRIHGSEPVEPEQPQQ